MIIEDIIDNYDVIQHDLWQLHPDKIQNLIQDLRKKDIEILSDLQRANIYKFVSKLDEDYLVDYLLNLLNTETTNLLSSPNTNSFLRQFRDILKKCQGFGRTPRKKEKKTFHDDDLKSILEYALSIHEKSIKPVEQIIKSWKKHKNYAN
jgi:hypothetical protein